jgi:hypothetical protein
VQEYRANWRRVNETKVVRRRPWGGTETLQPHEANKPGNENGAASARTPGKLLLGITIRREPPAPFACPNGRGNPSCCIKPNASQFSRDSANFPFARRRMVTPSDREFFVRGRNAPQIAFVSARGRPGHHNLIAFRKWCHSACSGDRGIPLGKGRPAACTLMVRSPGRESLHHDAAFPHSEGKAEPSSKKQNYAPARVEWRISRRKSGAKTSTVRHIS